MQLWSLDGGGDLQAALERLKLRASVEPLATVELLAEEEILDEGDDQQAAQERLEPPPSVELLAS